MALTTAPVELITLDDGVTITVDDNSDTLTLVSTDGDSSVGPILDLFRNSASPGNFDLLGKVLFSGEDSGGNKTEYAHLQAYPQVVTNGSESGYFELHSMVGGTDRVRFEANATEVAVNNPGIDSDFRVESDSNTHGLFLEASTGNVMIGHSSQDTPVDNGGAGVTLRPAGIMLIGGTGTSIYANREDSDGDIIEFRKDGTKIGSIGTNSGGIYLGSPSGAGKYMANNGNFSPLSDGSKNLGDSTVRWQDLYLSGGLFVGGTGSANELDDYEEGTFTPVVQGASTAGVFAYTLQQGTYTKIGRLVNYFVTIYVNNTTTSAVGDLTITGLPFTATNTGMAQYAGSTGWIQYVGFSNQFGVYVGGSSGTIIPRNSINGGSGGLPTGNDLANAFYIIISGAYHV